MGRGALLAFALAVPASLALLALPSSAQPGEARAGKLEFIAHQSESALSVEVGAFTPEIHFDPGSPQKGRVRIVIDTASASAGSRDADRMLRGAEFFDVASHPQAVYESEKIRALGGGKFEAMGTLALKGHNGPVTLAFTARPDAAGTTWFEGEGEISRLAFGIGEGQWADTSTVDDAVTIHFKVASK